MGGGMRVAVDAVGVLLRDGRPGRPESPCLHPESERERGGV